MSLTLLPGPSGSHTIHVAVVLVGTKPRIGFFDANGMLLDTSFQTFVTDTSSSNVTCTLEFALQPAGKKMFVQAKHHSPITPWKPNPAATVVSQEVSIGESSHAKGVGSNFNVIVADEWGAPGAIWIDPTWPLNRSSSGGPKAHGAPAKTTSYFYLTSRGTATNNKVLTLYVNVAEFKGSPYAWLSNADGVCVGSALVLCPPVGSSASDTVYCELELKQGSIASGYTVSCTNQNLDYPLVSEARGSFDVTISKSSSSWTSTWSWYGQTDPPGPVWTNA